MLVAIYLVIMGMIGDSDYGFGELTAEHMSREIKSVVVEDERRELALKNLNFIIADIADINERIGKDVEQLEVLVENYGSKPEDFDKFFSFTLDTRMRQIKKLIDDRQAMLQHITAEEWQVIIREATVAAENKS
ncbi:hypothetical protein [Kaarinaea lacus]